MSILNWQVSSSSYFSSVFSVITYNSSVSCTSCILYFEQKDPMKIPILILSSVLMKICQIPHVIFQITSQFFFKFCMTLQCLETKHLLCKFLGQTLYTLHKKDESKYKFSIIFSVRIKIYKILVIFETQNNFFFKFCTTLWYHETCFCHTFFS